MRAVLCLIFDLTVLFFRLAKRGGKSALVAELLGSVRKTVSKQLRQSDEQEDMGYEVSHGNS